MALAWERYSRLYANQLTQKSIEAIQAAQRMAQERNHTQIQQAHLLYALIDDAEDLNAQLLTAMQVNVTGLKGELLNLLNGQASYSGGGSGQLYASAALDKALNEAENRMQKMGDSYISVEHLMMGLIAEAALFSPLLILLQLNYTSKPKPAAISPGCRMSANILN